MSPRIELDRVNVRKMRDMLLVALRAAHHGFAPTSAVAEAVAGDNRTMHVNQLRFDSLAWMEFSISVELQSGQELTPEDIEHKRYVFEIEGVAAREVLNMLTTSSRASEHLPLALQCRTQNQFNQPH